MTLARIKHILRRKTVLGLDTEGLEDVVSNIAQDINYAHSGIVLTHSETDKFFFGYVFDKSAAQKLIQDRRNWLAEIFETVGNSRSDAMRFANSIVASARHPKWVRERD